MPAMNAADLAALRATPIGRDLTLFVFQPAVVWQGTVGGAPAYGDTDLTVATTFGNPADIEPGWTVRVETAAGAKKQHPSRVRFKSYSAPTMTVAENAIEWIAGDVLTAIRLPEIWPKPPYIDAATDPPTQYKDGDIAWPGIDESQPPKANAGPAAIARMSGGVADVVFRDWDSFQCPSGDPIGAGNYLWEFFGGAPAVIAGGVNTSTVTMRYTTAGYYLARLTVTDDNGIEGYVWIFVIIDDGTLSRTRIEPDERRWSSPGWVLTRRLMGVDGVDQWAYFYDGAPVFLVADSDDTATSAFFTDRSNLRWSGWLSEDRLSRSAYSREATYRAVSSAHILSNVPAYGVRFNSEAVPTDWYGFTDLSIDSVVYLLLHWHSTAMQVCHYEPIGEWTTRSRPAENCDLEDVLAQVNHVLTACYADLRCDRAGILRAMRHEWFLSAAEKAARATVLTLTNADFQNLDYGPRPHRPDVSQIRLLGVDSASSPFMSGAPGPVALEGGRPAEKQYLAPIDQDELNRWAGQDLAYRNWDQTVRLVMRGEWDCVDPAYGEYIAGTLSTFDPRAPDGPYSIVGVRFRDDHEVGVTIGEWELLPDPIAYSGETREFPEVPDPPEPDDPPDDGYEPPTPELGSGEVVIGGTYGAGVVYTLDALSGNPPTWYQLNGGLGDDSEIFWLVVDQTAPGLRAACLDGNKDLYVNNNWRGGDNWTLSLANSTLDTWASTTTEPVCLRSGPHGTLLLAFHQINGGYLNETTFAISTDWGVSWDYLDAPWINWGLWEDDPICDHTGLLPVPKNYWRLLLPGDGASYINSGGIVLFSYYGGDAIFITGRCYNVATFGRSAMAMILGIDVAAAQELPNNCPADHGDCDCSDLNYGLGDSSGGLTVAGGYGPVLNPNDGYIYVPSFKDYLVEDYTVARVAAHVPMYNDTGISDFITTAYLGGYPRSTCPPPVGISQEFFAAYVVPLDTETQIFLGNPSDDGSGDAYAPDVILAGTFRIIQSHRYMKDGKAVLFLAPSFNANERADAGDPRVFLVSQQYPASLGVYWTDKTGNLYDLGARGFSSIESDFSSD